MSDLRALYQEVILDHYKRPRNFGTLEPPVRVAQGSNPLCGDQIKVYVDHNGETVRRVSFEGHGCAISTASASLMTEAVSGLSLGEVEMLSQTFRDLVTSEGGKPVPVTEGERAELGKLEVLAGVREYPVRIKCATLAWHALSAAIESKAVASDQQVPVPAVSTE